MGDNDRDKLDEVIEAALRNEGSREAPFGFHRRVEERLHISILLEREKRRFRACSLGAASLAAAFAALSALVWYAGDVPSRIARAVPGVLGSYDHLLATFGRHWPAMALSSVGILLVLSTGFLLLNKRFVRRGA